MSEGIISEVYYPFYAYIKPMRYKKSG